MSAQIVGARRLPPNTFPIHSPARQRNQPALWIAWRLVHSGYSGYRLIAVVTAVRILPPADDSTGFAPHPRKVLVHSGIQCSTG